MAKFSDMDWAQYFKMDYAQSLRKDPRKAKKGPLQNFYMIVLAHLDRVVYMVSCKSLIKLVQSKMVDGKVNQKKKKATTNYYRLIFKKCQKKIQFYHKFLKIPRFSETTLTT